MIFLPRAVAEGNVLHPSGLGIEQCDWVKTRPELNPVSEPSMQEAQSPEIIRSCTMTKLNLRRSSTIKLIRLRLCLLLLLIIRMTIDEHRHNLSATIKDGSGVFYMEQ